MVLGEIALTADLLGKIFIAVTALRVHYRVRKEHKIDKNVFKAMRREQNLGIVGIILILIAYIIHLYLLYQ